MTVLTTDAGLARVVVITPKRRLEVALPDQLAVSALLPGLLRQGGDDLAIDGLTTGGWTVRRVDGAALDPSRTLAAQAIRDGEVLYLVPRHVDWPEPEYDDIVDAIAAGARRAERAWTPAATRIGGLSIAALAVLLIPVTALLSGDGGSRPAIVVLATAVLLMAGGTALSRAIGDSVAGGVIGLLAQPLGLVGGLLLGDRLDQPFWSAPTLLIGSVIVLLLAVAGFLAIADLRALFAGGAVAGFGGTVGAALALTNLGTDGAAAVTVTAVLLLGPAFPLLSVRLAKVPMPAVPRDVADLRASDTAMSFQATVARVTRSAELLTGALLGTGIVTVAASVVLALTASTSTLLLAATASAAHLLRARMLIALRQRVVVLLTGIAGLTVTAIGVILVLPTENRLTVVVPALAVVAVLACASALMYSRRAPSPRLGRLGDVLDVLLTLATGPITVAVLGLFHYMRGLAG